ncbi:MAG: hypothetical protein J6Q59_04050 [Paludibacteraceae bacterium]|nr:hypothetical protein [Paludibacteraceae bacterium]
MKKKKKPEKKKIKIKTMDVILVFIAVVLVTFTLEMVYLFTKYGAIPDTLCTCVFGAAVGEFGAMAWIRSNKDKAQDRKWRKQDRKYGDKEDIT